MISTYQRLKRRRDAGEIDGFTLIELLIVIVVLGILAAVVIFALGGVTGKSQLAACQSDGATIATALQAFKAENGTAATLTAALTESNYSINGSNAGGPYIQSWPTSNAFTFSLGAKGVLQVAGTSSGNTTPRNYTGPGACKLIGLS